MAGRSTALADWYPWIRPVYRHVPGWVSSFKSNVAHLFKLEAKLWLSLYEDAKGKAESGKLNPSKLARSLFSSQMTETIERRLLQRHDRARRDRKIQGFTDSARTRF